MKLFAAASLSVLISTTEANVGPEFKITQKVGWEEDLLKDDKHDGGRWDAQMTYDTIRHTYDAQEEKVKRALRAEKDAEETLKQAQQREATSRKLLKKAEDFSAVREVEGKAKKKELEETKAMLSKGKSRLSKDKDDLKKSEEELTQRETELKNLKGKIEIIDKKLAEQADEKIKPAIKKVEEKIAAQDKNITEAKDRLELAQKAFDKEAAVYQAANKDKNAAVARLDKAKTAFKNAHLRILRFRGKIELDVENNTAKVETFGNKTDEGSKKLEVKEPEVKPPTKSQAAVHKASGLLLAFAAAALLLMNQ